MSIARAIRIVLALAASLIVAWAFIDVGRRAVNRYQATHGRSVTLTVLHWGNKEEDGIVETLVKSYMEQNPNVNIIRINSGGTDYAAKIKTMMAAGTPPDVFYLPPNLFPDFAHMKLVRPIDDYYATEPQQWKDDFYPLLINAWRYDVSTSTVGRGPLYGLPKDFTTAVFYVNLDLFKAAGVPVPYDGWTWDEFEASMKKITALSDNPAFKGRKVYGGFFQLWPDTIRNMLWTCGGEFFGNHPDGTPNFRDVTLDEPGAQTALKLIARTRLQDQTVYNPTGISKDGGQEFFNGNIGCVGPIGQWMVPRYTTITNFKWDCVPIPHAKDLPPASQIYYTAWSMSNSAKHPDECYKLMKFLCGTEGQIQSAHMAVAVPSLRSVAESDHFLKPPKITPHNGQVFLDALKYARLQQSPREAEWTRLVDDYTKDSIQLGTEDTLTNAKKIESMWHAELDSPIRRGEWKPMRWDVVMSLTAAVLVTVVVIVVLKSRREQLGPLDRAQQRAGYAFILPWVIGFLLLTLGPMIMSLLLSFTRWSAIVPVSGADSVGLANYKQLAGDATFYKSLRVTAYFVILAVPVTQVAALAVALLMNMRLRGITIFRTVYFVPSVISGAALAVLWLQIFNNDYGLFNAILRPILKVVGTIPPNWFGVDQTVNPPVNDAARWAIPAFVIMGLWGVGSGMILYLAGLKGIPQSLYEAATIDGAGAGRKLWNVTLPMLSPLIFYNVVMGIIGSFQVFTQAYIMTGPGPANATLFYVLNLYRQAFEFHNMGYASAMAWILFLIILALTIFVFRGSKKLVYYEGLKA
ncbi:MAG: extracellular solute-binding protein [Anaerolineae bacterium]|nr:extracellular solute-binding protein [Phycisphaerae bacterium]